MFGLLSDGVEVSTFARLGGRQFAVGAFRAGRQQAVQAANHDQGHVVCGIPAFAQGFHLLEGHVLEVGALGALQAQLHGQLVAAWVADVLAVEPALQVAVMAAVLAFYDLFAVSKDVASMRVSRITDSSRSRTLRWLRAGASITKVVSALLV